MGSVESDVDLIARRATEQGLRVVTSESLTSGNIATRLGAGPDAASWFGGGVVAYQERVKFDLLGVKEGPVVTQECAEQMARGAVRMFDADVAVSATGVGGPGPSEGKPAGTVFLSVVTAKEVTSRELHLDGSPEEILEQTCEVAIALLADAVGADDTR